MGRPTDYATLDVRRDGRLVVCTLDRPEHRNAIDAEMHRELEDFFAGLEVDDDCDAVLLTGAGSAFSAGGDRAGMRARVEGRLEDRPGGIFTRGARRLIRNLLAVPQPIVAAVNGAAVGLGATLALFCDVVLAAADARIGDPHVRVGLVAGDGGAVIWPLLVGPNRAKEYLLTGRLLDAAEGERIGLVNHVHPPDRLFDEAHALTQQLAEGASAATRWTKLAVNKELWHRVNLALDTGLALEAVSATTADHREGVRAQFERREPRFTGW